MMAMIKADNVQVTISGKDILHSLSMALEQGTITAIIGPNGSGKSTFLKTIAKALTPSMGTICLNGQDLRTLKSQELAKQVAMLYQSSKAPGDITVRDLVEYGRFPYQTFWKSHTAEDGKIVDWAINETAMAELTDRAVVTLSGGEQQRAWIAMALAQQPKTLILDEPTTYLDIAHQLEVMELVKRLNAETGLTVVMVLHDLNHAARYSDFIIVLRQGRVAASGSPAEVITAAMLREVFEVEVDLWYDQENRPIFIPRGLTPKQAKEKQAKENE